MNQYTLLLVDDEEEVIQVIMHKIPWEELGFSVIGHANNGIKALDYQCQGDSLTLTLTETDFETVSNLNTALVEVRTDDGDLVEAHGGYALRAITYDKDKQTYTVACTTAADDTTAQAISQLVSKVEELEISNTALAAQVDYISMMTDTEVA